MKRIFLFIAMVMMSVLTMAQAPQKMNFQALVRNSSNELETNQMISMEISVLNGSNVAVYTETQSVTTNANGVATLVIGEGTATKGTFADIDWSAGNYYLQTTANLGGGASTIVGTTPLLSVPYALYAEKAGNTYSKEEIDAMLFSLTKQGAINAKFSVAKDKQVYFSQGNLQYQANTKTWRFAAHQYDIVGDDNSKISSTYSGWIDLFGWGTSGWNSGAKAYQPYSINTSYEDYYPGGSYTNDLTGSYANADWGVYNRISNGGNTTGQWRTLTRNEWEYILNGRTNASSLKGSATINGIKGLILLPDDWSTLVDVTFNSGINGFDSNIFTVKEWVVMESYGAVFLPAAGYRNGTTVSNVGSNGYYWSSSDNESGAEYAYCLNFRGDLARLDNSFRRNGRSVRLVRDL